jgi:hypothetical protein
MPWCFPLGAQPGSSVSSSRRGTRHIVTVQRAPNVARGHFSIDNLDRLSVRLLPKWRSIWTSGEIPRDLHSPLESGPVALVCFIPCCCTGRLALLCKVEKIFVRPQNCYRDGMVGGLRGVSSRDVHADAR